MAEHRYTYGDSKIAATRLRILAEVLAPTSESFLSRRVSGPVGLAVDLGCGPGVSTRLIAETLKPSMTVGVDRSEAFVGWAGEDAPEGVSFQVHDAMRTPFPTGPADLVYCRLLLPHLPDPSAVVARWATQVNPGGRLLLDEMDRVESPDPVFTEYLEVARTRVAAGGGSLFVGDELDAMLAPEGFVRESSEIVEFHPRAAPVAEIFRLNLEAIGEDAVRVDGYPPADLSALRKKLVQRANADVDTTWRTRQIAFRRQ